MFKYTYTNNKNKKINIIINNGNVEITKEIIQAFINQMENGKLHILENTYSGEVYACDTYLYETNYSIMNIKFDCLFGENDEILEMWINLDIKQDKEIHRFDIKEYALEKALINATCI